MNAEVNANEVAPSNYYEETSASLGASQGLAQADSTHLASSTASAPLLRLSNDRSPSREDDPIAISQTPLYQRGRTPPSELARIKNKRLRKFYRDQNELLDRYEEFEGLLRRRTYPERSRVEKESKSLATTAAISLSFLANVAILAAKVYVAAESGSLAVVTAVIDSVLDLLSGAIVLTINYMMRISNLSKYPVGRSRLENAGLMIYATVMASASLVVILEAAKQLSGNAVGFDSEETNVSTFVILAGTIVTKFGLWIWCRRFTSASVKALALDHRNDTLFNAVTSATLLVAWSLGEDWIDPASAIILSVYIMSSWALVGYHHLDLLVGRAASRKTTNEITFFVANFDRRILQVDTIRAYTFGARFILEVDIVLPEDMLLREAHDIGESLQNWLEEFANIERCFVHLDWEGRHQIEHREKTRRLGVAATAQGTSNGAAAQEEGGPV